MKTLKTLQTLSKIAKILCKIVFVCCIVGACGCVLGIIGIAACLPLVIDGRTFEEILLAEANVTAGTMYATMVAGIIACGVEIVLAKFAEKYFDNELLDGTPFTERGAKELLRLGILTVCLPIGSTIVIAIANAVIGVMCGAVAPLEFDNSSSVVLGVAFIIVALICRLGAETEARIANESNVAAEDKTEI